jgi:hypothetical protein
MQRVREEGMEPAELWKEYLAKAPGLAESHDPKQQAMRRTGTIDYVIVLDGEIWLELDDGSSTHLRQGDVVVQKASRYAWRNRSAAPCVLAEVMVGAASEAVEPPADEAADDSAPPVRGSQAVPRKGTRARPPHDSSAPSDRY